MIRKVNFIISAIFIAIAIIGFSTADALARPGQRFEAWIGPQPALVDLESFMDRVYPDRWTRLSGEEYGLAGDGIESVNGRYVGDKNILYRGHILPGQHVRNMFVPIWTQPWEITFEVLHQEEFLRQQDEVQEAERLYLEKRTRRLVEPLIYSR